MSKNTVLWPIACLSFQQVDVNTICYHKKAVKHVLLSIFLIYEINTSIYMYSVHVSTITYNYNCSAGFYIISKLWCFTDVFRECGGARCVHAMVQHLDCRQQALSIIQQLILSPQGDDDMATLLGLMHTSPVRSLQLKTHILKVRLKSTFITLDKTHIPKVRPDIYLVTNLTYSTSASISTS